MFVDIHSHVMRNSPMCGTAGRVTAAQLIARYDELGVEKGAVLPLIGPECFDPQSNADILDACAEYPARLIPFCCVHPQAAGNSSEGDLGAILRRYKDLGCKGVGEVTVNLPFSHPLMQNLFRHVEATCLPLTFHIHTRIGGGYGVYDDAGLPQLEDTLKKFTRLTFLGHSAAFWAEISELRTPEERDGYPNYPVTGEGAVPRLMRKYTNLYGDLSAGSGCNALARDPDFAVRFLDEFQDRLLFGLDIGSPNTGAPLAELLPRFLREGRISKIVFEKIARKNAIRILGLDG